MKFNALVAFDDDDTVFDADYDETNGVSVIGMFRLCGISGNGVNGTRCGWMIYSLSIHVKISILNISTDVFTIIDFENVILLL